MPDQQTKSAPPFVGTRVTDSIPLDDVEPLLDREALYASRWQFRQGQDPADWDDLKSKKIVPIYEGLIAQVRRNGTIAPAIIHGHFECERIGNGLLVKVGSRDFRFDFPRERHEPHRCIADFFPYGFATFQLATVGAGVASAAAADFADKKYSDAFYLKGLAAQFAEAVAEYGHRMIRKELGVGEGVGCRFSPGYPAFPSLLDQRKIVEMLDASRIGVTITETCQLIPEHSTTAIISIDGRASLFRP